MVVQDFNVLEDSIHLASFGEINVARLLKTDLAENGVINLGSGDRIIIYDHGQRIDPSQMTTRDVFATQTRVFVDAQSGQTGTAADELVVGGGQTHLLLSGFSADVLIGEAGNDKIFGGRGHDVLVSSEGVDRMWGGRGNDTFVFEPGSGNNVVKDFGNDHDKIELRGIDFAILRIEMKNAQTPSSLHRVCSQIVLRGMQLGNLNSNNFVMTGLAGQTFVTGGDGRDNIHGTIGDVTFILA
ncbi:calcium-binding protein [Sulfitobacter pacificus]|uniref:calcium-binding protein n=1 Tax=Sulfitobacter pacificus TaxID=1499314 RepID=UPI0036157931